MSDPTNPIDPATGELKPRDVIAIRADFEDWKSRIERGMRIVSHYGPLSPEARAVLPMIGSMLHWCFDVEVLLAEIDRLGRLVKLFESEDGVMVMRVQVDASDDPALTDPMDLAGDIIDTFNEDMSHRSGWPARNNNLDENGERVELLAAEWTR